MIKLNWLQLNNIFIPQWLLQRNSRENTSHHPHHHSRELSQTSSKATPAQHNLEFKCLTPSHYFVFSWLESNLSMLCWLDHSPRIHFTLECSVPLVQLSSQVPSFVSIRLFTIPNEPRDGVHEDFSSNSCLGIPRLHVCALPRLRQLRGLVHNYIIR